MAEPISLTELRAHLDITRTDQDAMLTGFITAAREWVENYTGLVLTPRTVTQAFDGFGTLVLHAWPLASAAHLTVTYTDTAGVEQTVADARLMLGRRPATVVPSFGGAWPSAREQVIVSVAAGYASPDDVPASLKAAMLLLCGSLYQTREDAVIGTIYTSTKAVESLCGPYRMVGLG